MPGLRLPMPHMTFPERFERFCTLQEAIAYRIASGPAYPESVEAVKMLAATQMALVDDELDRIVRITEAKEFSWD